MGTLTILNVLVLAGIVVSAVACVMAKDNLSSAIALGVAGAFVALEFVVLQAPDVAIAEAAVGAVLGTVIFVIGIKKTTKKGDREQ